MTLCLNCQKEVKPTEGKRAKKYCSGSCRASHYQKTHPKREKKYVLMKTHQKVLDELKELRSKVRFASESHDSYDGKPDTALKLDEVGQTPQPPQEAPTYDFTGMKWLEIEKVTRFPIKDRPAGFDERLAWDKARRLEHEEIRKQWANRNKKP